MIANMNGNAAFRHPDRFLAGMEPGRAAELVAAATDIALLVDADGIVRDLSVGGADLDGRAAALWIDQPWIDSVTMESRPKIRAILEEAGRGERPRRRQVNHPSPGGDVPVLYGAMPVATGGLVALGRDLRAVAALQQRLVRAQQSLEADYSRLRQAELRYRLMFQLAGEPVLILDAATLQVTDANPAAAALLGLGGGLVQGEPLDRVLPGAAAAVVAGLVARQASSAAPEEATIRLAGGRQLVATASLLREEGGVQALVRLRPSAAREPGAADAASSSQLMDLIASLPDAFVVTTPSGAVVASNPAFAAMVQLASVAQAQDQPLERWLGRGSVDWHVLRDHLRGAGAIRLYATTLRDGHGGTLDVEISAVAVSGQGEDCLGFVIRHVGRRLATAVGESRLAPQAVEQLAGLVGRVPMKDLVRETAELIERMCIEAALHLTGNSRASAAEILGLSRQSLYVKLNRYGIGRGEAGAAADADGDRD